MALREPSVLTVSANHASSSEVVMRYQVLPSDSRVWGASSLTAPLQTLLPGSMATGTVSAACWTRKEPFALI